MFSLGGFRERRQGGDKVENTPAYGFINIAVFDKVVHPPYYTPENMPYHDRGRCDQRITSCNTKYPQPELFFISPNQKSQFVLRWFCLVPMNMCQDTI